LLAKYMQHTPIRGAAHNTTHPPVRAHGSERWREAGQAHLPVRAPRVRCHGLSGAGRQGRMRVRRFCQERAHRHARELRGRRDVVPGDLRVCKDRGPRVLERHDHSVCQVGERWPLPETIIFASDWDPRQLTADAGAHMQSARLPRILAHLHLVCKRTSLVDFVFKIEFSFSKMCIQGVLCAFAKKKEMHFVHPLTIVHLREKQYLGHLGGKGAQVLFSDKSKTTLGFIYHTGKKIFVSKRKQ
jgi:hypothetical protein